MCDLPKPPLYSRLAEAMGLWAQTVDEPARLQSVLREALAEVRQGPLRAGGYLRLVIPASGRWLSGNMPNLGNPERPL